MTTPRLLPAVSLVSALVAPLVAQPPAAPPREDPRKAYALIFGTVFAPDNRPAYGVRVKIRRAAEKKARWELFSDRRGEFAQRLPVGSADYVVWADVQGPKDRPRAEVKVHIENDERVDISLHLVE
ncbi:MAG TPA: hypothetical protein VGQ94_08810 [Terriglobales bacterium]|nr:hypothetical protein [Terriglobales bacterium]